MRTLQLPFGQAVPILGMGSWQMGEHAHNSQGEIAALRPGLEPLRSSRQGMFLEIKGFSVLMLAAAGLWNFYLMAA